MSSKKQDVEARIQEMRTDWENSRVSAVSDARRLYNLVDKIREVYEKENPSIGDLLQLKDCLAVFDHCLAESFNFVFYNEFVAKWIDIFRPTELKDIVEED